MPSLNKVLLMGHLGKAPESRTTPTGRKVVVFSIASNERWKDASNQRQEHTEWHDIEAWGPLAEFVEKYVTKGQAVYVEGSVRTDKWEDKTTKQPRSRSKIVARDIRLLSPKKEDIDFDVPSFGEVDSAAAE